MAYKGAIAIDHDRDLPEIIIVFNKIAYWLKVKNNSASG